MGNSISNSEAPRVVGDSPKPEQPKAIDNEQPPTHTTNHTPSAQKVEMFTV
jgi:hypothetical protein